MKKNSCLVMIIIFSLVKKIIFLPENKKKQLFQEKIISLLKNKNNCFREKIFFYQKIRKVVLGENCFFTKKNKTIIVLGENYFFTKKKDLKKLF